MDTQVCGICTKPLPLEAFAYKRLGIPCKKCVPKIYHAAWRSRNRRRLKAISSAWKLAHPEAQRKAAAKYRQSPKYKALNRVHIQNRRSLKLGSGMFSLDEWLALLAQHNYKCLACGTTESISIDHVIPLSKGGRNTIDNLQPLCLTCNSSKGVSETDYRVTNGHFDNHCT